MSNIQIKDKLSNQYCQGCKKIKQPLLRFKNRLVCQSCKDEFKLKIPKFCFDCGIETKSRKRKLENILCSKHQYKYQSLSFIQSLDEENLMKPRQDFINLMQNLNGAVEWVSLNYRFELCSSYEFHPEEQKLSLDRRTAQYRSCSYSIQQGYTHYRGVDYWRKRVWKGGYLYFFSYCQAVLYGKGLKSKVQIIRIKG